MLTRENKQRKPYRRIIHINVIDNPNRVVGLHDRALAHWINYFRRITAYRKLNGFKIGKTQRQARNTERVIAQGWYTRHNETQPIFEPVPYVHKKMGGEQ